jgi:cobalt-precorrin-5B (C1)-methyltransferase
MSAYRHDSTDAANGALSAGATSSRRPTKGPLRRGFSTGTAATAAARAALRFAITGACPGVVAVRLPGEVFLPIRIKGCVLLADGVRATVIKDGGDDPDVTHGALIEATVRWRVNVAGSGGIRLVGGEGVGVVTKPGLPVVIGEPAINPAPRAMLGRNLEDEWQRCNGSGLRPGGPHERLEEPAKPSVWLSLQGESALSANVLLEVTIQVPKGVELARHTLNPRLGIVGGISILGTTGIVKPFSHEAYEETIQAGLAVAAATGCREIVLSTGGKSERFAREALPGWREEAFVQIADFFAFAVRETAARGFSAVVHSAFFGKVVKMAQGHAYTHAHRSPLELQPLALLAGERGYGAALTEALAGANTARQALELLLAEGAGDVVEAVARQALKQARGFAGRPIALRLMLFDYDGTLLVDVKHVD